MLCPIQRTQDNQLVEIFGHQQQNAFRPEVCDNLNKNKGELPVVGKIAPMTVRAALAELCGAASGRSGVSNIIGSINQPTNFINRPTCSSSLPCHHPMI